VRPGTVVLVTGAAGGIGGAVLDAVRARGAIGIGADLAAGERVDVALDVTDGDACRAAVAAVVDEHGRLDVVVTAAGVGTAGRFDALDEAAWRRTIDVNLWGTVHVARAAWPVLTEQGSGHLVLVASLSGLVPTPLLVPYATSKHAVVGLARSLAPEGRRAGIGVTAVCPGPVDTRMLDTGGAGGEVRGVDVRRYLTAAAGRPVRPETVAEAVVSAIGGRRTVVAVPARTALIARLDRWAPRATEAVIERAMRAELRLADAGQR
jgi:NAD(P)-dependent dehydrogenase (short-subunit alcohol dehydrogenase family)